MNTKIFNGLIVAFSFFCLSATGFYFWSIPDEQNTEELRTTQSQKSKKLDHRNVELGTVTDSLSKVLNEPSALFNDPAIKQAWGLKKSDAARAWSISRGSKKVIVAVIDTGVDANHEDLKTNLWQNPGETGLDASGHDKSKNGIDDDGNGFIDDVHGWNFVSNNNKLDDNHGHGTHIAGIIGAEAGNNKGISGIAPDVSLMVLKYYDPKVPNTDNLKNTIQAMNYAVKMGAHIINYSGGGTEYSQEEHDAVASAEKKGILFVAAAGNERSNSDEHHYYPADYKLKNIISVTAIDPTTEVLSSSNFGTDTVDIAAPGQNILSSLPNNTYGLMTGTSQATAFVTGAAVLVIAHKQLYNNAIEVRNFILATGDSSASLFNKTKSARQLNLFKCLTILNYNDSITGLTRNNIDTKDFDSRTSVSNNQDPNINTEADKEVKKMAGFSQDLIKVISGEAPGKRNRNKERLGNIPEPKSDSN